MKHCRLMYKQRVKDYGEGSVGAIELGVNLAGCHVKSNQVVEATRLLKSLLATRSKQVHDGATYRLAQDVEAKLRRCKIRWVKVESLDGTNRRFQALRYNGDCSKLVVQRATKMFYVDVEKEQFELGTPVICHGLIGSLRHSNKVSSFTM